MKAMDEYKCGDCFYADLCEESETLVGFNRDHPASCSTFLNSDDVDPVRPELRNAVKELQKQYERAIKNPGVRNKLAWALFHTWKQMDEGDDKV